MANGDDQSQFWQGAQDQLQQGDWRNHSINMSAWPGVDVTHQGQGLGTQPVWFPVPQLYSGTPLPGNADINPTGSIYPVNMQNQVGQEMDAEDAIRNQLAFGQARQQYSPMGVPQFDPQLIAQHGQLMDPMVHVAQFWQWYQNQNNPSMQQSLDQIVQQARSLINAWYHGPGWQPDEPQGGSEDPNANR